MATMKFKGDGEVAMQHRLEAGQWIASLRKKIPMTQAEFAKALGYEWYTFISQIESGKNRVPSDAMEAWAKVLGVNPTQFAKTLLRHYDPALFKLLFSVDGKAKG